jgi:hypothetical protein
MQLPETTIANQSLLKMGLRNANQVDVFSAVFSMAGAVTLGICARLLALRVARVIQETRTLANIGNSSTDNKWTITE